MESKKKKICWITPDYYLIVDAPKVPILANDYDISWILINTYKTNRKTDGLLQHEFRPEEYNLRYRQKDPRIILQYLSFIKKIRRLKADLIYISFHGFPYFLPLFLFFFDPEKIVWGVHNVRTPKGASNSRFMDKYQDYVFKKIRKIHVFSDYQLAVARELFPDKRHFLIPLTLEDYGISKILPPDNTIRFLFFGYIKEYKGLDLLIQSFCDLRKSGYGNIELMVAGTCDNWPQYEKLINGDHAIKARIESIPNSEIPDVVCSCHYIVLPYRDSAQSGVLNISFQYNRPVIISDIDAFRNSVSDGTTGYFFKNGSQESLTEVMKKVIEGHPAKYQKMKENIKDYVQKKFAMDIILEKYRGLLDNCLS